MKKEAKEKEAGLQAKAYSSEYYRLPFDLTVLRVLLLVEKDKS